MPILIQLSLGLGSQLKSESQPWNLVNMRCFWNPLGAPVGLEPYINARQYCGLVSFFPFIYAIINITLYKPNLCNLDLFCSINTLVTANLTLHCATFPPFDLLSLYTTSNPLLLLWGGRLTPAWRLKPSWHHLSSAVMTHTPSLHNAVPLSHSH